MQFETLDSQIAKGLMQSHELRVQENNQVAQEMQEKTGLPMLTGRLIAFMIHALFKVSDVQGGATGVKLMNIELRNDKLEDVRPGLGRDIDGNQN